MGIAFIPASTALIAFLTVAAAAVLAGVVIGFWRCGAAAGGAIQRTRISARLPIAGFAALLVLSALMLGCGAPDKAEAKPQIVTQTPDAAPVATPQPTQAVFTLQDGMSQKTLDLFTNLCHDIMYYSNEYCGTRYIVAAETHYTPEAAMNQLQLFILGTQADPELTTLAFNKCQLVYNELQWYREGDSTDELAARIQNALQGFEDYFDAELIQLNPDGTIDTEKTDDAAKAQPPANDSLNRKIYVTEGYQDGGMYVEGQAFYFENGQVFAGLPDDSEAAIKANSLYFTPFDMYYSLEGDTITITGGGNTSYWRYDAAQDAIIAGGTIMTRKN